MSPFEAIDHLTIYKTPWNKLSQTDQKSYNAFMVNKILSMNKDLIDIINLIQYFGKTTSIIPIHCQYQMYLNMLPDKKLYPKYIKKTQDKYNKDLLGIISGYFQISQDEAKMYIDNLGKEDISKILWSLGHDEKSIKKLMK